MPLTIDEIKVEMEKILQAIQRDRTLLLGIKSTGSHDQRITVENLEDLAGNHLFDDMPESFGLTKDEAYMVRGYFQQGAADGYNFIPELYNAFPNIFEGERPEYLEMVNEYRAIKGLEPLPLDKYLRK